MGQVNPFTRNVEALDPEALRILGAAYDRAISRLNGQATSETCELVAARIIDAGLHGKCDVEELHRLALTGILSPALHR